MEETQSAIEIDILGSHDLQSMQMQMRDKIHFLDILLSYRGGASLGNRRLNTCGDSFQSRTVT